MKFIDQWFWKQNYIPLNTLLSWKSVNYPLVILLSEDYQTNNYKYGKL